MNRIAYDPERVIAKLAAQLADAHARLAKLEVVVETRNEEDRAAAVQPEGTP